MSQEPNATLDHSESTVAARHAVATRGTIIMFRRQAGHVKREVHRLIVVPVATLGRPLIIRKRGVERDVQLIGVRRRRAPASPETCPHASTWHQWDDRSPTGLTRRMRAPSASLLGASGVRTIQPVLQQVNLTTIACRTRRGHRPAASL